MKIKRYLDKSMRHVLRRVREDQGPDAVILSNRRVDGGIEVIAAIDYDEALVRHALGAAPDAATEAVINSEALAEIAEDDVQISRAAASAAAAPSIVSTDLVASNADETALRKMETEIAGLVVRSP